MKKGFTLAEMLVVISLVAVIGAIMVAIFVNTLRGSNKSQILAVIKQNGQAVLEDMDKVIRGADNVVCISVDKNTLVVKDVNETGKVTYIRFRLVPSDNSTTNGSIQQDNPVKEIISGSEETDETFTNRVCIDSLNQPNTLTNTNTQTGVKVSSDGLFSNEGSAANNIITIKFELGPAIGVPEAVSGQIDPVPFQTTIKLRNS